MSHRRILAGLDVASILAIGGAFSANQLTNDRIPVNADLKADPPIQRRGYCECGKRISVNKDLCLACATKKEAE